MAVSVQLLGLGLVSSLGFNAGFMANQYLVFQSPENEAERYSDIWMQTNHNEFYFRFSKL